MNEEVSKESGLALKVPELEIKEGEWPCTADKLGRSQEIENLTPILMNVEAPLVLAIDAEWGTGKTTFIKLWEQYLKIEGKKVLYLNAWENDFADDPLIPLLALIDDWMKEGGVSGEIKGKWEKVKELTPVMFKRLLVAGTKAATYGALDVEAGIEGVASELASQSVSGILNSFNNSRSTLDEFEDLLGAILEGLPDHQKNLVIFIDELDRCRPTYAIEMLERIKHLFGIPRIVFVLATNSKQLANSVQGVYGPAFDGAGYLQRFVDISYTPASPDIAKYVEYCVGQQVALSHLNSNLNPKELESVADDLSTLVARLGLPLRDINKVMERIRLALLSIPENQTIDIFPLLWLVILRHANKSLYDKFSTDSGAAREVAEFLFGEVPNDQYSAHNYAWSAARLVVSTGVSRNYLPELDLALRPWQDLLESLDPTDHRHDVVQSIFDSVEDRAFVRGVSGKGYSINIIELAHKLKMVHST